MKGEESIFCDDESRMDMINRVFKGRMIPLIIIFFAIIIPQLFLQSHAGRAENNDIFYLFLALFVLYVFLFVKFGIQFWKLNKSRKN